MVFKIVVIKQDMAQDTQGGKNTKPFQKVTVQQKVGCGGSPFLGSLLQVLSNNVHCRDPH